MDWRPAFVLETAPVGATKVSAFVAIESDESLPGRFLVRDAQVQSVADLNALSKDDAVLRLSAQDEHNKPLLARWYVQDAQGTYLQPRFSYTYNQGGGCFHVSDPSLNVLRLAPGRYRISAMAGFERAIVSREIDLTKGGVQDLALSLPKTMDLAREGWYSGDHHTHLYRHGGSMFPMMSLADVYTVAKGEGLSYLPFMGLMTGDEGSMPASEPNFIACVTEELTRDFWGHICPIGVTGNPDISTMALDPRVEAGELWPMNFDFTEDAVKRSGAMAYAHPYGPVRHDWETESLSDPGSGLVARGYPIDLALGQTPTLDILTKEDANGEFALKLRDYMRLLSLGFKSGVSGSTDFHLEQGREPIGGLRTYVQAGTLDWDSVSEAYMRGATFATNGPLVLFTANEFGPGETVRLTAPGEVSVRVRYRAIASAHVRLYVNGIVAAEHRDEDGVGEFEAMVPITESGWALAIVEGPDQPFIMREPEGRPLVAGQYAITSPVYLEVTGHPQTIDAASATYFVRWIDAVQAGYAREADETKLAGIEVPEQVNSAVQDRLSRARRVFEALAAR